MCDAWTISSRRQCSEAEAPYSADLATPLKALGRSNLMGLGALPIRLLPQCPGEIALRVVNFEQHSLFHAAG